MLKFCRIICRMPRKCYRCKLLRDLMNGMCPWRHFYINYLWIRCKAQVWMKQTTALETSFKQVSTVHTHGNVFFELDRHGVDSSEHFRLNGNIMFSSNIYGKKKFFDRKIQKQTKNWKKLKKILQKLRIITVVCFLMYWRMKHIWIEEAFSWKYHSISLIPIVKVSTVDMSYNEAHSVV